MKFDTSSLTYAEQEVVDCARIGLKADFSKISGDKPLIRGEFLRHLLLGLPVNAETEGRTTSTRWEVGPPGVAIRSARIGGVLDLSCAGLSGAEIPTLILEFCEIPEKIDLSCSHIAMFSIKGSHFRTIIMAEATIDGPFDFSDSDSFVADGEGKSDQNELVAWIDARNCVVGGSIDGSRAHLRAPPPTSRLPVGTVPTIALRFSGCEISRTVKLCDSFSAVGGVSFSSAHLFGNLYLNGAKLQHRDGHAFEAQNTEIDGSLLFDNQFVADGCVWLRGIRIGGTLQFSGASLSGTEGKSFGRALDVEDSKVEGAIRFTDQFSARGQVNVAAADIGGNVVCLNSKFINPVDSGLDSALTFSGTNISGMLYVYSSSFTGMVDCRGANIGRDLSFCKSKIESFGGNESAAALFAQGLRVSGGCIFQHFQARGTIKFLSAHIRGQLCIQDTQLKNMADGGGEALLVCEGAVIDGSVRLFPNFSSEGRIGFESAKIQGTFNAEGAKITCAENDKHGIVLTLMDAQLNGSVLLRNGFEAIGQIFLGRAKIKGSLDLDGARISQISINNTFSLVAPYAVIDGGVSMRRNLVSHGGVVFTYSRIGGNLDCSTAKFIAQEDTKILDAFDLRMAHVKGNVIFNAGSEVTGRINLIRTKIDGGLLFLNSNLYINATSYSTYVAECEGLHVEGNLTLENVEVFGGINLEQAKIGGILLWNGVRFLDRKFPEDIKSEPPEISNKLYASLSLMDAEISGALSARKITTNVPLVLNLMRLYTRTLDDSWPSGWGYDDKLNKVFWKINGLSYDIVHGMLGAIDDRIRWLSLQISEEYPERHFFFAAISAACYRSKSPRIQHRRKKHSYIRTSFNSKRKSLFEAVSFTFRVYVRLWIIASSCNDNSEYCIHYRNVRRIHCSESKYAST